MSSIAACGADAAADADRAPKSTSIDWTAIDISADPCSDFYQYACGSWASAHPLADDTYSSSRFDLRGDVISAKLREIIQADARGDRKRDDPYAAAIGNFFTSCMNAPEDAAARDELRAWLQPVMAIASADDLARQIAILDQLGSVALFSAEVVRDAGDPKRYVMRFDQGGYALRNRSDYLDDATADLRRAYHDHTRDLAAIFGDVAIDIDQAIAIETALARATSTPAQQRDAFATHNAMTVSDLAALTPNFAWNAYLKRAGLAAQKNVTVTNPDYFRALDRLLADTPLPALQSYLALRLVQSKAAWLDRDVAQQDFAFWSSHYDGRTALPERSLICAQEVQVRLGWPLAVPFMHRNGLGDLVKRATDLLEDVRASVHDRIAMVDWLDAATRAAAQNKLAEEIALIGYTSAVGDYSALALDPNSYLKNGAAIAGFEHLRTLAALSEQAERRVWGDTPFLINTTYFPSKNAVEFPGAMLGEPFFAPNDSASSNYAALGALMGHELNHAFDDNGRFFDAGGALRNWWSPNADPAYINRAQCLIDQFSAYTIADGTHVDGELTLGENIADLEGLSAAFDAWQRNGESEVAVNDHSPAQQFFLKFAQSWCVNLRPEKAHQDVVSDPHAPRQFRVNGTLVNIPAFADAFSCQAPAPAVAAASDAALCQLW